MQSLCISFYISFFFRFEAKRVIVRQGHPASAFYFILSGSVVVMVTEGELKVAKPVAYLVKGMTFGVSIGTEMMKFRGTCHVNSFSSE